MALAGIIWDLTTQALHFYVTAPAQEAADQIHGSSLAEAALPSQPSPPPWVEICSPAVTGNTGHKSH